MEQYKPHPEHSHLLVYRDGRVYSTKTNRFLSGLSDHGYVTITITGKDIQQHSRYVHQLVMDTWGSSAPSNVQDPVIDHIDENKLNNSIDNLRWLSRKQNARRSTQGSKHHKAKLSEQDVIEIRALRNKDPKFYTHRVLGELYSVSRSMIAYLCQGKYWTHI